MQELRKCQGQLYDETNAMSINTVEFSYTDAACNTTVNQPANGSEGSSRSLTHRSGREAVWSVDG